MKGGFLDSVCDYPGPGVRPASTGINWDGVSGLLLPTVEVEAAMKAEIAYMRRLGEYSPVVQGHVHQEFTRCRRKWVLVNKGRRLEIRARLVAAETLAL